MNVPLKVNHLQLELTAFINKLTQFNDKQHIYFTIIRENNREIYLDL